MCKCTCKCMLLACATYCTCTCVHVHVAGLQDQEHTCSFLASTLAMIGVLQEPLSHESNYHRDPERQGASNLINAAA